MSSLLCHYYFISSLSFHYYFIIISLLFHNDFTIISVLFHYYFTSGSLLYFTIISRLFHSYFTMFSLLVHYCFAIISLLVHDEFTIISLLFSYYFTIITQGKTSQEKREKGKAPTHDLVWFSPYIQTARTLARTARHETISRLVSSPQPPIIAYNPPWQNSDFNKQG